MCAQIADLPEELLWAVLVWLGDWEDLAVAACTCRSWNRIVDEPLWRHAYANRGWSAPSVVPPCWRTAFKEGGGEFACLMSSCSDTEDGFLCRLLASLGAAAKLKTFDLLLDPLPDLSKFDAVVLIAGGTFLERVDGLGDALADYVDAGGGVVLSCYALCGFPPTGRWCTCGHHVFTWLPGDYSPMINKTSYGRSALRMDPDCDVRHPLLCNVGSLSFVGFQLSPLPVGPGELTKGSIRVASWIGGYALAAVRPRKHSEDGLVVALNLDPRWKEESGDAAALVANALRYARRPRSRRRSGE